MSIIAPITNISRGSLHDGPGVRTVVYFKGCGLRCKWCHNPETFSAKKQILYASTKCIHCGRCIEICPEHHKIKDDNMQFIREGCSACGKCVSACPSLALSLCGEEKTIDEVFNEIAKDIHYYETSGGGVTFSGGECLLYPNFVKELALKCKENNIHIVVESAFFVPWANIEAVLPFIDLFFVDLKISNPQKHIEFTGQDNKLIIENITKLSKIHSNIILRIPIIPNVNDSSKDIEGFAEIIKAFGDGIRAVELLKYNYLAESKYALVGSKYTKFAENSQSKEQMKSLCESLAEKCGKNCYFV